MSSLNSQPNLSFEYKESNLTLKLLLSLVIIIIVIMIGLPLYVVNTRIKQLNIQLIEKNKEYDEIINKTENKPVNLEQIKLDIKELEQQLQTNQVKYNKIEISMFELLEKIVPQDTWLTTIELMPDSIKIKGHTKNLKSIDFFFNELKKSSQHKLKLDTTIEHDTYDFEIQNIKNAQ